MLIFISQMGKDEKVWKRSVLASVQQRGALLLLWES